MLIRLLSLILLLLLPTQSLAARFFTTGLEENDFTTTMWSASSGSPAISTTHVHSGTYALRINPSSSAIFARKPYATTITANNTNVYQRFYVYPVSIGATSEIYAVASSTAAGAWKLSLLTSQKLRLTNIIASTTFDSSYTLPLNAWTRIEVRHQISDTTGQIEVRLYSVDSLTASDTYGDGNFTGGDGSDADTLPTDVQRFYAGQFATNGTCDVYYDDFAFNDDGGSFQNSWPGPGKIALVNPASDTTVTWTRGGSSPAATNWQSVSDVPSIAPDDGVTLNCDTTTCSVLSDTNEDKLGVSALPAEVPSNAVMTLIDLSGRVNVATAVSGTMAFVIWDEASTRTQGPTMTVNSVTWRITTTAEHQVLTLAGKTRANVNSFNIGYKALSGTVAKQVTALWASVEWLEASTSGPRNFMEMGVGK